MRYDFKLNSSKFIDVLNHLKKCNNDFNPPLDQRVDIEFYASKIVNSALRFEAWNGSILIGLVAIYMNDKRTVNAFITNVSVENSYKGQGIATKLLTQCIDHVSRAGFRRIELKVSEENKAAISLYVSLGFNQVTESETGFITFERLFS